jgi:hypothetical protein
MLFICLCNFLLWFCLSLSFVHQYCQRLAINRGYHEDSLMNHARGILILVAVFWIVCVNFDNYKYAQKAISHSVTQLWPEIGAIITYIWGLTIGKFCHCIVSGNKLAQSKLFFISSTMRSHARKYRLLLVTYTFSVHKSLALISSSIFVTSLGNIFLCTHEILSW